MNWVSKQSQNAGQKKYHKQGTSSIHNTSFQCCNQKCNLRRHSRCSISQGYDVYHSEQIHSIRILLFQIKEDEAREYKDSVGWEYEILLKKLVDAKQEYLKVV